MLKLYDDKWSFARIMLLYFLLTGFIWVNTFLLPRKRILKEPKLNEISETEKLKLDEESDENLSTMRILKAPFFWSNCLLFFINSLRYWFYNFCKIQSYAGGWSLWRPWVELSVYWTRIKTKSSSQRLPTSVNNISPHQREI